MGRALATFGLAEASALSLELPNSSISKKKIGDCHEGPGSDELSHCHCAA